MRQRNMMAIAIVCGALCAVSIGVFLASVQGKANAERAEVLARYGGEQVEVCVATRDISAGERVDASAVETRLWVADLLPEEAIRQSADAVGKTATTSILKGEVISAKRFVGERGMLDVPTGKEAVSVPAKAVQAVGGAIRAGMSVDVYSAGDSTTAIARNVVVLDTSVGGSGSLLSSDSGWITLAVDPERVQELIAAANKTSLYFAVPGEGSAREDQANGEQDGVQGGAPSAASSDKDSPSAQPASGSASSAAAPKENAEGDPDYAYEPEEGGEER